MAGKGRKQKQGGRRTTSTAALVMAMLLMLTLVLLMLLSLGILSLPSLPDSSSSSFPHPRSLFGGRRAGFGYAVIVTGRIKPDELAEGEFYLFTAPLSYRNEVGKIERRREQWSEILSWEPRAFLYHNFLSKEECEHLVNLAKPHMAKSTVVDSETGESIDSRVRTSSGMFLNRGQDKIIKNIEKKIADYTFIPVEHGEGLQVLHYEAGEKYEPHHDYFQDAFNTKNGGQRIATVLMYLSDVEEGGETIFPEAKGNISSVPWWNELSECGKTGLAVKPKMGDALLFWSMHPDATLDTSSLHGGCPVIKGNKWSSTKWMHVDEYKV